MQVPASIISTLLFRVLVQPMHKPMQSYLIPKVFGVSIKVFKWQFYVLESKIMTNQKDLEIALSRSRVIYTCPTEERITLFYCRVYFFFKHVYAT